MSGKEMTKSDFLSRHPGHDLASLNEIIPFYLQIRELLNNADKLNNVVLQPYVKFSLSQGGTNCTTLKQCGIASATLFNKF